MKYKLTNQTKEYYGRTLHRIECVESFSNVKVGDFGGWVESEDNLSKFGDAWVSDNAVVCGDAVVSDNAVVRNNAVVRDDAVVSGDAVVRDDAVVCDNAVVRDNAVVCGDAVVKSSVDYIVIKNSWSSYRYFTYTSSNNKWCVGCFYGTGEALIEKAYKDSELSGKCYEASVRYVEEIERIKSDKQNKGE